MPHALPLLALLLAPTLGADPIPVERGIHLTYRGNLVAEKGDQTSTEKVFRLSLLVGQASAEGLQVYWTLEEQGRGSWSWLDHFGRADLRRPWKTREASEPALLYEREEGTSVVPISLPLLLHDQQLAPDVRWVDGRLEYHVQRAVRLKDRDAWQIAVGNAYGRQRTLWVDRDSHAILAVEENVFIGQGEKHLLRYALVAQPPLSPEQVDAEITAFDSLLQLRKQLGFDPQTKEVKWSAPQLKQLEQLLPTVQEQVQTAALASVVQEASQDRDRQEDRAGAISALQSRLLDAPAPQPELTGLADEAFDWEPLQDKVTVLHFWEYRDAPLEEPYGQIAYLDFLYRNRDSELLQVFGVAVDARLNDPATRSQAVRGVKKLQSFMNLSYPLLLDPGAAIRQYGDPRVTGAKLPLFVVIDRAGKVVHYHVGTYQVAPDRGLDELKSVVTQALGSPE